MDPAMKVPKIRFEILPVVLPPHPVHPRRGLRPKREIRRPQAIDVNVVQERGEPRILVLLCDSAHAVQRAWHAHSGSESGACRVGRVLLAQAASLPRLRRRLTGLVRRAHRYYRPVRLLMTVHLRRATSAFPERPALPSPRRAAMRSPGSRHEEIARVLGFSDPAGSAGHSR